MRTLITGGAGQLGTDLKALLGDEAVSVTHAQLDITDPAQVERTLGEVRPEVVVNCAAFHNVDQCEREPEPAWATNVRAVMELAKSSAAHDAKLVHLSTNYVFDGRRPEPYAEHDLPGPRSVYALTKLAGEYAALAYGRDTLVVRSAGLYGLAGNASKGGNFVQRMLGRAREAGAVKMVADQRLQPTFTADLAPALVHAVRGGASGVLHLTNSGACSWLEFTEAILENAGIEVPIEPVRTSLGPGSVDRPLNGVLTSTRVTEPLRPWREALDDYMQRAGLSA